MNAWRIGVEDRIDRESFTRLNWQFFQLTTVMRQAYGHQPRMSVVGASIDARVGI